MASKANATSAQWKKLTARKIDIAKQEEGFEFNGLYKGLVLGAPFNDVDKKTGEVIERRLTQAIFEDEKGERFFMLADKGLQAALTESMVKEGQHILVKKLPKAAISKGRTMNQYDVFTA